MPKFVYTAFYFLWRIYDFLSSDMCPQGGHRIKSGLITNVCGTTYCLHKDCLAANAKEVEQKLGLKIKLP